MVGAKSLWDSNLGGMMPSTRSQELFERRKSEAFSQGGFRFDGSNPSIDKCLNKSETQKEIEKARIKKEALKELNLKLKQAEAERLQNLEFIKKNKENNQEMFSGVPSRITRSHLPYKSEVIEEFKGGEEDDAEDDKLSKEDSFERDTD